MLSAYIVVYRVKMYLLTLSISIVNTFSHVWSFSNVSVTSSLLYDFIRVETRFSYIYWLQMHLIKPYKNESFQIDYTNCWTSDSNFLIHLKICPLWKVITLALKKCLSSDVLSDYELCVARQMASANAIVNKLITN